MDQVENDLKRPLEDAKKSIADITEKSDDTKKSLTAIEEYVENKITTPLTLSSRISNKSVGFCIIRKSAG